MNSMNDNVNDKINKLEQDFHRQQQMSALSVERSRHHQPSYYFSPSSSPYAREREREREDARSSSRHYNAYDFYPGEERSGYKDRIGSPNPFVADQRKNFGATGPVRCPPSTNQFYT